MKITLTTISPLAHGDFSDGIDLGNAQNFRRIPMIRDAKVYDIPVLSGNALRGRIRRLLTRELVERFGLVEALGKQFNKFYIAVANGGNLDKDLEVSVDTEKIRRLRADIPLVSVLGSALYKYMLPGMCNIGFAVPRCKELGTGEITLDKIVCDVGLVRHIDKTVADAGDAKPMPYTVEAIVPGVELDATVEFAPQATPVERACIHHGLSLIQSLAGKNASGFGAVKIDGIEDDTAYVDWLNAAESKVNVLSFARSL